MAFRRWFPRSLVEQAAFYNNFTRVFVEEAAALGFSAADVAALEADNAVMQYLRMADIMVGSYMSAFRAVKKHLTLGGEGEPSYIQFQSPAEPPIVPGGMFDRLFYLADRICAAKNYSDSIGARLGILPPRREPLNPHDLTPKIKAAALYGARLEVKFTRGATSGIALYFRRAHGEEWFELGRFFSSPIVVRFPLLDAAKPEQINLRARCLIGNDPAGNFSPIKELVIAP